MQNYSEEIRDYLNIEKQTLDRLDVNAISDAMNLIIEAYEGKHTIYILGNGGSSATASHFENDFNKGLSENLVKKFRFRCLSDNMATVMAISNDIGFDEVFRYQLRGRLDYGDLVIAISGSGNSKNVINAVEYAKEKGNKVIGMTGYKGGKLKKLSDVSLHVDVMSMQVTEDVHMIFDHMMMSILYKSLCGISHLVQ